MKNRSRMLLTWIAVLVAPLVLSLVGYLVADPFCVLHRRLYAPGFPVAINRDYASTELYLHQHAEQGYDSFIFGSSRSTAFRCDDWKASMRRADARCFHFDAWKESLFGLEAKVRLVDALGSPLRDALIVVDGSLLAEVVPSSEPVFRSHPRLTGQSGLAFELDYLIDFYSNHFCLKYLDYALSGKVRGYMGPAFNARNFTHLLATNDEIFTAVDEKIARPGEDYWRSHADLFGPRTGGTAPLTVLSEQRRLLSSMAEIFARHGTRVRVVVSPLYDQIRLHPADLGALREIFGQDNVVDFSGENPMTSDVRNYYESSHFRPPVARAILSGLYTRGAQSRPRDSSQDLSQALSPDRWRARAPGPPDPPDH
jgi:hypothetical protein